MNIKLAETYSQTFRLVPLGWYNGKAPIKVGITAMILDWEMTEVLFKYAPEQRVVYFNNYKEGVSKQDLIHYINILNLKMVETYLD